MDTVNSAPEQRSITAITAHNVTLFCSSLAMHLGFVVSLVQRYQEQRLQQSDKEAFHHLLMLDEALLDDIGVTRDSVAWASSLPPPLVAPRALHEWVRATRKTA